MDNRMISSSSRHAPMVSIDTVRIVLGVSAYAAVVLHMLTPQWQSPLSSDKKSKGIAEDRIKILAQQAGIPPPKARVHLSLPYTSPAETIGLQRGPKWLIPELVISLHRDVVTQLPTRQLDCILGHELGHIALRKWPENPIFSKSDRNKSEISTLWGHHEEYAADWFGAQLCGKENMIDFVQYWATERSPDGNRTSKHFSHPLGRERVENLQLSNQTFLYLGTQIEGFNSTEIRDFTIGLFKDDGEFKFSQIATIGVLAFLVIKKKTNLFRN